MWNLELDPEGLTCSVDMVTDDEFIIEDLSIKTMVDDRYRSYSAIDEQGRIRGSVKNRIICASMPYMGLGPSREGPWILFHGAGTYLPSFHLGRHAFGKTYVNMTDDRVSLRKGMNRAAGMHVSIFRDEKSWSGKIPPRKP